MQTPNRVVYLYHQPTTACNTPCVLSEVESRLDMSEQESAPPVPPATFDFLVASLRFQAEVALGLFKMKEEEKPDLDAARHLIDLLAVLEEKTKGNLTIDESRLLGNSITELRFRYVQAAGEASKSTIITP